MNLLEAEKAIAHARALMDVRTLPMAGLVLLGTGLLLSLLAPTWADWRWSLGIAAMLLVAPPFLARMLPARGLRTYRLGLLVYLLNGLLLAIIAYREISRMAGLLPGDWPMLQAGLPWIAPLFSALYYLLQFHGWRERILRWPEVREAMAEPPPEAVQAEARALLRVALATSPAQEGVAWAEFRTVPASPRNWRLFLKLDSQRHGLWRVILCPEFAIVVFRDGSRAEAVPRGAMRMVAEDPSPQAKALQCLARWNGHLHEGRIAPDHFYRIQAWNKGPALEQAPDGESSPG